MSAEPRLARELTAAQLARYSRHLTLPGVGITGQNRIANAKVLIIGAGGLGSPIASYLIAAGVKQLSVIDPDSVELSNLQRQILHREQDRGALKVASVQRLAQELNSEVTVHCHATYLAPANALELFAEHDVVIDGSDNFATRYLTSDAAEITGIPLVWGTIFQFSGQVSVFDPQSGPMLRDIFPEMPEADSVPSCAEGGVFGALCGVVGSLMATEALKIITKVGQPLNGKLWLYDALTADVQILSFDRDPQREPVRELGQYEPQSCSVVLPGEEIDVSEVEKLRAQGQLVLLDVRESWERALATIEGSIHMPLEQLSGDSWKQFPWEQGTRVVTVCKTGPRSVRAALTLNAARPATLAPVLSLHGGTLRWLAQIRGQVVNY
ncbi:ThiF family adenylyltransferase [Glutamicibacter sp.]|uniref:ThiF family adenylyltransferase n=1 Tax=Glutamicibacter sp. TaxID=1931995 RepID=UPI002B4905CD|nr:ThiF family adenylyltransferase [Glutamicibacter sp.]HJX77765.1 ThiF family adenylyltransferase [Glutamicibacter sp.]